MIPKNSLGHAGLVKTETPGRADAHPVDTPPGSFVFPADVVSAMGQGNTLSGAKALRSLLRSPKPARGPLPRAQKRFADGGAVPIAVSGGEYIATPEEISYLGDGNLDRGLAIADMLVRKIRAQHIEHLRRLPPPNR